MHQQFADHAHLEIGLGHAPDLAGGERLGTGPAGGLGFYHGLSCAKTFKHTSQLARRLTMPAA
jgi:hypothetical protein